MRKVIRGEFCIESGENKITSSGTSVFSTSDVEVVCVATNDIAAEIAEDYRENGFCSQTNEKTCFLLSSMIGVQKL